MKSIALLSCMLVTSTLSAAPQVVALSGKSPLVTIRVVFKVGSALDPAGKEGLAALTASMLADGGSKTKTYKQLVDAMYPMATNVSAQVDKEMTTISAVTHIDNLEPFYALFREMLLEPGWRQEDFDRLRDDQVNYLRVTLRGNNDEELGKEVLYNRIYEGHPYGHHNAGTASALKSITIADLQKFYKENYTRANLIIGLAGGFPEAFRARMVKDFDKLAEGKPAVLKLAQPKPVKGIRMTMIEKPTRSVAYSLGFPIDVKRGHPDYVPLLIAQSYLGQHRNSSGRLYNRMRQTRGLNYGDYAYIEYFPNGMFQFEPSPNLARSQQIFQMWIRPVETPTAHFALRLAMFELQKFVTDGIPEEGFNDTKLFLSKYVNLLTKTKTAELGYAIDSAWYGIPDYNSYIKGALAKVTREDVNRAIRKHLRADNLDIVVVAQNTAGLKDSFLSEAPSPMTYNSPKPEEVVAEDKTVQALKLGLKPEAIQITPVDKVFE